LLFPARLENVYGDPLVICVVVGGDDTIEYEVAPTTVLKLNVIFDNVISVEVMLVTAAGVVINGGDVDVPPYPLALDDVIANV
jgi:hypothetical protein